MRRRLHWLPLSALALAIAALGSLGGARDLPLIPLAVAAAFFAGSAYATTTVAAGGSEPPLRRGPLRGHTQHSRGNQSVLRGPHVPPRKESNTENVSSDRGDTANGFGNGL